MTTEANKVSAQRMVDEVAHGWSGFSAVEQASQLLDFRGR